jgi:hypothetical protein
VADTSLIFNVIARDSGLGRVLDKIAGGFKGAGASAEEALEKAGAGTENLDRQIAEVQARVRSLSEEFERTGDKTLFGKINRDKALVSQLTKIRNELKNTGDDGEDADRKLGGLAGMFSRVGGMASNFGSSLSSAGSSVSGLISSISGLVAVGIGLAFFGTVAAPALYALGGAAAAIPAMLSGAIAAIATLKMGMSGLSENWAAMNAPKTGGGGGGGGAAPKVDMTPKIRAVEAAQRELARSSRDVADAQKALAEAQKNVAKAHEVAKERLSDLNREYRQAKQDQAEEAQGLIEAEQQLRLAQGRGNPDEIMRAQMAVDKQRLALEEAADKADDLGKEYKDASAKGIEGSDEVTAAKKEEAQAARALQDATEAHTLAVQRLGDAQRSLKEKIAATSSAGGGLGGVVLPKIARSAQEFLDKLKELKPAFDALRLDVQQRLFAGLADKLDVLASRWMPALKRQLGGMADTINGVVKTAFDSLSDPQFISNMEVGLDAFRGMLGKIGQAIAGPLVDAWGRLTRAAKPILDVIGDKVAGIITRFSEWIAKMDDNGSLDSFMAEAAKILGDIFDMLEDIGSIAGSVISILFGTGTATGGWDGLKKTLDSIAKWLANPENQEKVSEFIDGFWAAGVAVVRFLQWLGNIPGYVRNVIAWFQNLYRGVDTWLSNLPKSAQRWFSNMMNTAAAWVRSGVNAIGSYFGGLGTRIYNNIRNLPGVFRNIGSWLWNAVSGLYNNMLSVGYNIVAGIWNGIAGRANWLYNQAKNFAAGIWNSVQDALGIGSPSKVMAKEVGHWIPEGVAVGMDDNRNSIVRAASRMAAILKGTRISGPSVDMDGALGSADATLTVAARRQKIEVVSRLDVTGQEGKFKTLVRGMARTDNLYQTGSAA